MYPEAMTTTEHPITRSELREELDVRLRHYATKADLASLETKLSAKMDAQVRWLVGFQMLGLGIIAAIMRFLGT